MNKYLYGASIQGIQEFIFTTNELKEIVGASEIVKSIEDDFKREYIPKSIIRKAGGSIKAVFNEEECKKVVKEFPKRVMQKAYGITISQAVVEFTGDYTQEDIDKLEGKLKTQRNRPSIPLDLSINIMKLNPKTAKPAIKYEKAKGKAKERKPIDKASKQKREAYDTWLNSKEKSRNQEFKELDDMSNGKNKIAVIHADGNGLGSLIPKLKNTYSLELSNFSEQLDEAIKEAFNSARDERMSIREIVLGGDDMTVICNANDALEFTNNFLHNFEEETAKIFEKKHKLTACAGIVYCNAKFPFHYAIALAESLCSATKKQAKEVNPNPAPSSLMFHNIQSSHFQSWDRFIKDELTITNQDKSIRCDFGLYYVKENEPKIQNLIDTIHAYNQAGSPKARLREWLSQLHKSQNLADNLLKRINEVMAQSSKWDEESMNNNLKKLHPHLSNSDLIIQKDALDKTPIYDILQILSATEIKDDTKI